MRTTRSASASVKEHDTPEPNDIADVPERKTSDASKRQEKSKKPRHRMTNRQLEHLESLYQRSTHPSRQEKEALANKVGMDTRTVTIWFQNRRQLAKKADENAGPTGYTAMSDHRTVLGLVDQPSENIDLSPNPSSEFGLGKVLTTLQAAARRVQPTSGCAYTTNTRIPSVTPPVLIQIGEPEDEAPRTRKKSGTKRMLEQACSRAEKRMRLQRTEEEEDHGDTTEDEDSPLDCKAADVLASLKRDPLKDVCIPTEYSSSFAPDIVLGASLLLTFKYSAY
ncbi:hypothetical protein EUX98_g746 [Antrodiella citrinella]|uniref:Homeobox domain-containing protein n=1 Tax=Antrodiella citrinella TaxID=2447956 RepID=A0A4S4NBV1_9APHY|nr:hypothetical protein EUX98_g746 [Antrodiella citrinella]